MRRAGSPVQASSFPRHANETPAFRSLELQTKEPNQFYDALVPLAVETGLPLSGFSSPDSNLESIFRYLVNE